MLSLVLFVSSLVFDTTMTIDEQNRTGISELSSEKKQALANWIEDYCTHQCNAPKASKLYLSQNIDQGKQLLLTDGSLYEVSPDDTNITASWILPFPIQIETGSDPNFPLVIKNINSGTHVKAKQLKPPQ